LSEDSLLARGGGGADHYFVVVDIDIDIDMDIPPHCGNLLDACSASTPHNDSLPVGLRHSPAMSLYAHQPFPDARGHTPHPYPLPDFTTLISCTPL
jgi:hypothetical protein